MDRKEMVVKAKKIVKAMVAAGMPDLIELEWIDSYSVEELDYIIVNHESWLK